MYKIILMFLSIGALYGQESSVTNGGNFEANDGSTVAFTIGLPLYSTLEGDGLETQGVEHGYWLIEPIAPFEVVRTAVYPNPFSEALFIELDTRLYSNLSYRIFDFAGKFVQAGVLTQNKTELKLEMLQAGMYFLSIKEGARALGEYKLIKK